MASSKLKQRQTSQLWRLKLFSQTLNGQPTIWADTFTSKFDNLSYESNLILGANTRFKKSNASTRVKTFCNVFLWIENNLQIHYTTPTHTSSTCMFMQELEAITTTSIQMKTTQRHRLSAAQASANVLMTMELSTIKTPSSWKREGLLSHNRYRSKL